MKALLIDVAKRTISEVQYEGLADLHRMLGGYLEIATSWPNGDTLYVDDEGKLKGKPGCFILPGIEDIFAGNGVLVGRETDDFNGRNGKQEQS